MKLSPIQVASLLLLGMLSPVCRAQDQPKAESKPGTEAKSVTGTTKDKNKKQAEVSSEDKQKGDGQVTPLKVTVVFSEYDGEKKLSSLPYTLFLKVGDEQKRYYGNMRMGVRVPIATGGKESQIQYQDVGSNIDCEARSAQDDRYLLDLRLERSSIYTTRDERPADQKAVEQSFASAPLVRQFRASFALMLRDGQTMQSTVATDPLNGRTVRVDVTLNVLK